MVAITLSGSDLHPCARGYAKSDAAVNFASEHFSFAGLLGTFVMVKIISLPLVPQGCMRIVCTYVERTPAKYPCAYCRCTLKFVGQYAVCTGKHVILM